MSVESLNVQSEPALEIYQIRYKNGEKDYVRAFKIHFQLRGADVIKFFKSEMVEDDQIFVNASAVDSAIPYSSMVDAPLVIELQGQISTLTDRVNSIENNLTNVITQAVGAAVNAAFAARGF